MSVAQAGTEHRKRRHKSSGDSYALRAQNLTARLDALQEEADHTVNRNLLEVLQHDVLLVRLTGQVVAATFAQHFSATCALCVCK